MITRLDPLNPRTSLWTFEHTGHTAHHGWGEEHICICSKVCICICIYICILWVLLSFLLPPEFARAPHSKVSLLKKAEKLKKVKSFARIYHFSKSNLKTVKKTLLSPVLSAASRNLRADTESTRPLARTITKKMVKKTKFWCRKKEIIESRRVTGQKKMAKPSTFEGRKESPSWRAETSRPSARNISIISSVAVPSLKQYANQYFNNNNSTNISIGGSTQPATIFQYFNPYFNHYWLKYFIQ